MADELKPGVYRHYRGNEYRVLCVAKNSETLEDFVVYEALHVNFVSKTWVRPLAMFREAIEIDGKKVRRFQYIRPA